MVNTSKKWLTISRLLRRRKSCQFAKEGKPRGPTHLRRFNSCLKSGLGKQTQSRAGPVGVLDLQLPTGAWWPGSFCRAGKPACWASDRTTKRCPGRSQRQPASSDTPWKETLEILESGFAQVPQPPNDSPPGPPAASARSPMPLASLSAAELEGSRSAGKVRRSNSRSGRLASGADGEHAGSSPAGRRSR